MSKLQALIRSRRFWLMLATSVGFIVNELAGKVVSQEAINAIALAVGGWIVGDSLRPTE